MNRIIFVLVISIGLFSSWVFAGVRVDPVTLEVVAPKGGEKEGVIKVGNTSEKPMQVTVSPEKFGGVDKDVGTWLTFEPMEQIIKGYEEKEIRYKLKMPEDSVGELRCMIFLVADEVTEGGPSSSLGIRFGIPVYAIVSGTEIINAEIQDINVGYDYVNKFLNGTIYINNKSNIHIRPNIEIQIFNSRGKLVIGLDLPYGQPAQANQNRPFMFQQNLLLGIGKYKFYAKVDYGKLYGIINKVAEKGKAFIVKVPVEEISQEKKDEKGKE